MTLNHDLAQEFWRAAAVAWGCFVIGVYCFRLTLTDPSRHSRLVGQILSRSLILCGMLVLTGFGSHAVSEYRQLVDRRGGPSGPAHAVGETLLAEVRHVDRIRSDDGWTAEFTEHGPAGRARVRVAGSVPTAGGRGFSGSTRGQSGDEESGRAVEEAETLQGLEWAASERL